MATPGYLPTRDEMRLIIEAARNLFQVIKRWQKHAHLPGFPVERGNHSALNVLFGLERALNPRRLPWGQQGRGDLTVRNWPTGVDDGIAWLRRLLDLLLKKNQLESMATAPDFDCWTAECQRLPPTVSIAEDELLALRTAIRMLPCLDALSNGGLDEAVPASPRPTGSLQRIGEIVSVILPEPGVGPLVLGRLKSPLTQPQYRVVKALLVAGDAGLSKAQLLEISGDAVNVLKRLARSDDDWRAVIHLPGSPGRRYRIGAPAMPDQPTHPPTASSTPPHTTPHSSKLTRP